MTDQTNPKRDPEVSRLRRLAAAFDAIMCDDEAIGAFSRSAQQDIRLQAELWSRRLRNAVQERSVA